MQLSKKTLQTTLSVIQLRVPSDHPFKKTKWMCLMQSEFLE